MKRKRIISMILSVVTVLSFAFSNLTNALDDWVSLPEKIDNIVYDGLTHELITDTSKSNGDMLYVVTTENIAPEDDNAWQSDFPAKKDAGTYYVWYKTRNYTSDTSIEVSIQSKTIGIDWSNTSLTYNGNEQAPTATAKNVVDGDNIALTVSGKQTNANTSVNEPYTATVTAITGEDANNYILPEGISTTFTIAKASQDAPSVNKTNETIKGKNDGKITDVTSNMEYRKEKETNYNSINSSSITGLAAGKYYVRYKEDNNHNASSDTEVTIESGRKLIVTIPTDQIGYTLSTDKSSVDYNEAITITFALKPGYSNGTIYKNGEEIALTNNRATIKVTEDLTIAVDGVTDTQKPTGSIKISDNTWQELLNTITFGLFFKDSQTVTITGNDNSGNCTIGYLLSNKELSQQELNNATFTSYTESFNINPNNKYVVYAKITDSSNNVTYISSDGVVLDNKAPIINGVKDSKTYCSKQTITISDDNLDIVKVNDIEVTLTDDKYELLPGNTYKIEAIDKAGNSTVVNSVAVGHHTIKIDKVDSTITSNGNIEYWYCDNCNTIFKDENCTISMEIEDTIIDKKTLQITDGKNQSFKLDETKELSFRSNDSYAYFQKVTVDGNEISEDNYTVREGSIIVTLKNSYLNTLSEGSHTISIVSLNGEATTNFTITRQTNDENNPILNPFTSDTNNSNTSDKSNVKTGDNTSIVICIVGLLIGLVGIRYYKKEDIKRR